MNAALFRCIVDSLDKPVATDAVLVMKMQGDSADCTLSVGRYVNLVRRQCVLEAGCANVLLCLPAGLSLSILGSTQPRKALTVAGEPVEFEMQGVGGEPYVVICDVEQKDLRLLATADTGRLDGLSVVPSGDARAVSLEAIEHRLTQIDNLQQGLLECSQECPGLDLFGGASNFLVKECSMPPSLCVQRDVLGRIEGCVNALAMVRLDAGIDALHHVAAQRLSALDLEQFKANVAHLLQTRNTVTHDITNTRTKNRAHTRVSYHVLQSVDECLRAHVCEACGSDSEDFALQHKARLFEMQQLCANNAKNTTPIAQDVLRDTLSLLESLPKAPVATKNCKYKSAMVRSLYASAILHALPRNSFAIATHTNFSYFRPHESRLRSENVVKEFLLQKIETDQRHGIIPQLLARHICTLVQDTANNLNVDRLLSIFDNDLHPLIMAAADGSVSAATYSYLDTSRERTGYQAIATSSLMLQLLQV